MRWLLLFVVACHGDPPAVGRPAPTATAAPPPVVAGAPQPADAAPAPELPLDTSYTCTQEAFAATTPVAEASAAAWYAGGLVVTSDSGNDGQYAIVDPDTGATRELGHWPLGAASDDVEGLAAGPDGKLYGLTSGGWMRAWTRDAGGKAFALVDGPYPVGDPAGELACAPKRGNCKRDYEGLCLAAHPPAGAPCVGFALSRHDGALYCLARAADSGRLAVRADIPPIGVGGGMPKSMADCAFDDADHLFVAGNGLDLARVYRVVGWQDPARAQAAVIGSLAVGFPEALAVRGDAFYRFSDTGGAPSASAKFRCAPAGR